ncbi:hypothetical protein [Sporomusa aerivorans]|uniref:hypothetical protein n=1 Tax=Sporomusa aerivorans TaxID=204936 RepID=UPI00352BC2E5
MTENQESVKETVKENVKVTAFEKYLIDNKVEGFASRAVTDQLNSVVFHSNLAVKGQNLPVAVIIDDSVYTMIQIQAVSGAASGKSPQELAIYANELNQTYRMLKYQVTPEGNLALSCCVASDHDNFEPKLVIGILDQILQHLNEEYPNFMRKIWTE